MWNFDNEKQRKHSRKTEQKVKSELIQLILETNKDFDDNTLNEKAENASKCEDARSIVKQCEELIQRQQGNMNRIPYKQVNALKKFKESESFSKMVEEPSISKVNNDFKYKFI